MKLLLLLIGLTLVTYSVSLNVTYDDLMKMSGTYLNTIDEDDLERYRRGTFERRIAPETLECLNPLPMTKELRVELKLNNKKFQTYLDVYGIIITTFGESNDEVMRRACYIIKFMLADNANVRNAMYSHQVRFIMLGDGESIENIPGMIINRDYSTGGVYYGKQRYPVVVFTKEYVLCKPNGTRKEFMHVVAHIMIKYAIPEVFPYFKRRVREAYYNARSLGQLKGRYSQFGYKEYFAEGVLAFFNQVSVGKLGPRHLDTSRNTRARLQKHDQTLYNLVNQIFPCANTNYVNRCDTNIVAMTQEIQMDCLVLLADPPCEDLMLDCPFMAEMGVCNDEHMGTQGISNNCPYSCGKCTRATTNIHEDVIPTIDDEIIDECADDQFSSFRCQNLVDNDLCHSENMIAFSSVNCKQSCGFCGGAKVLTLDDIVPIITEHTILEYVDENACEDDVYSSSVCDQLVSENTCRTTHMLRFSSLNCKKSCGFCEAENESAVDEQVIPEVCADGEYSAVGCQQIVEAKNCYEDGFNAFALDHCQKSCGFCVEEDDDDVPSLWQAPPAEVLPSFSVERPVIIPNAIGVAIEESCMDTYHNCQNRRKSECETNDFMKENCRKYCDLC